MRLLYNKYIDITGVAKIAKKAVKMMPDLWIIVQLYS